jgi:tetratricopeptide (TPR) repeat protein
VRCHASARFDVQSHSHHSGTKAPLCIDCHMPPNTFMQIDERRDHSIRIPRPDHSVAFGTPNACNGCHSKETATWARDQLARWSPQTATRAHFVTALAKDRKGTLDAAHELAEIATSAATPALARATALERLGHYPAQTTVRVLRTALASSEPLVVYGAVLGCAELTPAQRLPLLLPALEHPTRAVRVAAAKLLASVPVAQFPAALRPALTRAFDEVMQGFAVSASRAESHVEVSAFELARGRLSQAEHALQTALRLHPCLAEAQLNLADLARQRRDEPAAERAIRAALTCAPQNAAAHHALGLWQVRAGQSAAALVSLERAVELAPGDTRFRYALALALHAGGQRDEAIRMLEAAHQQRANDADILRALASYLHDAGQSARAAQVARELQAVLAP